MGLPKRGLKRAGFNPRNGKLAERRGRKAWGPRTVSRPDRPAAKRRLKMRKMSQWAVEFLKKEDGPTAVEYAVMLALIVVVCITAITTLGTNANNTFSYVANQIGGGSGS